MRTLAGISITLTALILAYILRRPTLRYVFHHDEEVKTPADWTPKMRNWNNGALVNGD